MSEQLQPGFYRMVPTVDEQLAQLEQAKASLLAQKEAEAQAAVNPIFKLSSEATNDELVLQHQIDAFEHRISDLERRVDRFLEIAYTGHVPEELQAKLPLET